MCFCINRVDCNIWWDHGPYARIIIFKKLDIIDAANHTERISIQCIKFSFWKIQPDTHRRTWLSCRHDSDISVHIAFAPMLPDGTWISIKRWSDNAQVLTVGFDLRHNISICTGNRNPYIIIAVINCYRCSLCTWIQCTCCNRNACRNRTLSWCICITQESIFLYTTTTCRNDRVSCTWAWSGSGPVHNNKHVFPIRRKSNVPETVGASKIAYCISAIGRNDCSSCRTKFELQYPAPF